MTTDISTVLREDINALNGRAPLILAELRHPDLTDVVRLAQDTVNWGSTAGGSTRNLYIGIGFRLTWPDQQAEQLPRASVEIDNVGRELTRWVEMTGGGSGAELTLILVSRRTPNRVERKVTLGISNVRLTSSTLSADLGFDNLLDRPACRLYYRPDVAPGVF